MKAQKGFSAILILVGILVLGLVAGGAYYFTKIKPSQINSFIEECKKVGGGILEMYPPLCQTPDGKTFKPGEKISAKIIISPRPTIVDETVYTEGTRSANWKTYINEEYGYSIKYPNDHQIKKGINYDFQLSKEKNTFTFVILGFSLGKNIIEELDNGFCQTKKENITEERINNVSFYKSERIYNENNICLDAVADLNKKTVDSFWILDIQAKVQNNEGRDTFNQILSTFKFLPALADKDQNQTGKTQILETQAIEIAKKAIRETDIKKTRALVVDNVRYGKVWEVDLFLNESGVRMNGKTVLVSIESGKVIEVLDLSIMP